MAELLGSHEGSSAPFEFVHHARPVGQKRAAGEGAQRFRHVGKRARDGLHRDPAVVRERSGRQDFRLRRAGLGRAGSGLARLSAGHGHLPGVTIEGAKAGFNYTMSACVRWRKRAGPRRGSKCSIAAICPARRTATVAVRTELSAPPASATEPLLGRTALLAGLRRAEDRPERRSMPGVHLLQAPAGRSPSRALGPRQAVALPNPSAAAGRRRGSARHGRRQFGMRSFRMDDAETRRADVPQRPRDRAPRRQHHGLRAAVTSCSKDFGAVGRRHSCWPRSCT